MNCIIAQSGGPTSVINASVYGLVKANKKLNLYKNELIIIILYKYIAIYRNLLIYKLS